MSTSDEETPSNLYEDESEDELEELPYEDVVDEDDEEYEDYEDDEAEMKAWWQS
jgi:hypothetical protein